MTPSKNPKQIQKKIKSNASIRKQTNTVNNNELIEKFNWLKKLTYLMFAIIIILVFLYFQPFLSSYVSHYGKPNFGSTLSNIDMPLSSANLAIINNASNNNFEIAAQMLINKSLKDPVLPFPANKTNQYPQFIVNGKPSVIYVGAITCVFCGENRWAMALALSRFGSFSKLFYGYSALGDHDVPTLYWNQDNYTTTGIGYSNYYSSNYINFISADSEANISQGFTVQPLSVFVADAPNLTYKQAYAFMNSTNKFQGTPFTFWGTTLLPGADAIVFGNSTPSSSTLPLTYMTHQQVLNQLKNFNDQFAYGEYAAADVYIAYTCPSINNVAQVCSLPAIKELELLMNLT